VSLQLVTLSERPDNVTLPCVEPKPEPVKVSVPSGVASVGDTAVSVGNVTLTERVPWADVSATLVAVMVSGPVEPVGAVKSPALLMLPAETDHVTFWSSSPATTAV
jgi:hypothetical protein